MTRQRRTPCRTSGAGFTLIEALVVVSIIGLLMALLIPAVMHVRESARRLECTNRLKQLGIALQTHQSVSRSFPPPMPPRSFEKGRWWSSSESLSGYYELLPYMELAAVYNSINTGGAGSATSQDGLPPESGANATAYGVRLDQFLCPSDYQTGNFSNGPNSFRFNVGSSNPLGAGLIVLATGAFETNISARPEDFRDGLSQTAGFCERVVGSGPLASFDRKRDFWGAGVLALLPIESDNQVLEVCRSLSASPVAYKSNLGHSWMMGGNIDVWYNHVAPPNDRGSDCEAGDLNTQQDPGYCIFCSLSARSVHSGGANCLAMDGSVHFISDGIDLRVWRALGTRSGGETVQAGW